MKRILIFLCTIASTAGYISCSDSAIGDEYGSTLIYMPQATHNLGTDNNLTLKLSKEAVTATPSKRTQTTLGIYRAGTAPKESATGRSADRQGLPHLGPTIRPKRKCRKQIRHLQDGRTARQEILRQTAGNADHSEWQPRSDDTTCPAQCGNIRGLPCRPNPAAARSDRKSDTLHPEPFAVANHGRHHTGRLIENKTMKIPIRFLLTTLLGLWTGASVQAATPKCWSRLHVTGIGDFALHSISARILGTAFLDDPKHPDLFMLGDQILQERMFPVQLRGPGKRRRSRLPNGKSG